MIVSDRPIVAVDVDEPLADFVAAVLREVADITGQPRARDEITDFDISSSLQLSDEHSTEMWRRVAQPGFCRNLTTIPGAHEALREIREYADVRAVTSPFKSPTWAHERETWLIRQMGFKRDEVIQTPGKDVVFAHVYIDDKIETLFKWRDRWPTSHVIRFSAPWNENRGWTGHSSSDWGVIKRLVRSLVGR